MRFTKKPYYTMDDLQAIVKLLRAPGGCPWDAEQTHESIRKNLIEETYEVVDAIDKKDAHLLQEELGDVLLQVLMHTEMEEEKGTFTFDDVCNEVAQKLVYRHPHVFGDTAGDTTLSSQQVLEKWEKLKNKEKKRETVNDRLGSVPEALPALMRAQKIQKRADDFGFGYSGPQLALKDLEDEVAELKDAINQSHNIAGEIGDVLFSATNAARLLGYDAEEALTVSTNRFVARVAFAEKQAEKAGQAVSQLSPEDRDLYWKQAKKHEKE